MNEGDAYVDEPIAEGIAYCAHDLAAVRAEPDDGSERVTELARWDEAAILAEGEQWVRVRIPSQAGYEGWLRADALAHGAFDSPTHAVVDPCVPLSRAGDASGRCAGVLWLGQWVRVVAQTASVHVLAGPDGETYEAPARCFSTLDHGLPPRSLQRRIKRVASRMLGTPYLWGGMSFRGIDCSGLVQRVYRAVGITLRRDAGQQWHDACAIEAEARCGDAVFFGDGDAVEHVGLMLSGGWFVHASGAHSMVVVSHLGEERWSQRRLGTRRPGAPHGSDGHGT